jgi:hypothetical protein
MIIPDGRASNRVEARNCGTLIRTAKAVLDNG